VVFRFLAYFYLWVNSLSRHGSARSRGNSASTVLTATPVFGSRTTPSGQEPLRQPALNPNPISNPENKMFPGVSFLPGALCLDTLCSVGKRNFDPVKNRNQWTDCRKLSPLTVSETNPFAKFWTNPSTGGFCPTVRRSVHQNDTIYSKKRPKCSTAARLLLITPRRSQRWQHAIELNTGRESRFLPTPCTCIWRPR